MTTFEMTTIRESLVTNSKETVKGFYIMLVITIIFVLLFVAIVAVLYIILNYLFGGCCKLTSNAWSSVCKRMKERRDDDKDSDQGDANSLSSIVLFDQTTLNDEIIQPPIKLETLRPRMHDKLA